MGIAQCMGLLWRHDRRELELGLCDAIDGRRALRVADKQMGRGRKGVGLGLIRLAYLVRLFGPKMGQLAWALVGHWAWVPQKEKYK